MSQFATDRRLLLARRQSLAWLGAGAGAFLLTGCGRSGMGSPPGEMGPNRSYADFTTIGPDGREYVAFPGETEGPYPADGRGRQTVANVLGGAALQRADIRSSFGEMRGTALGVPLRLELQVVDIDNKAASLAGHALYVWHCNAAGEYSLYSVKDQNYLRGLQVTDGQGRVAFQTIVPACYDGRWPHIHFELFRDARSATGGRDAILTSQLAVPEAVDKAVYAAAPVYAGSADNLAKVSLKKDNVFGDNTAKQIAAQTLAMTGDPRSGYRAQATIGYTKTYAS